MTTEDPEQLHPRARRQIDRRNRRLVIALLGPLYELENRDTIEERELVATFAGSEWTEKTIKRTIGELVDFGAVRRLVYTGGPRYGRRQPARLRLTDLGRAWSDRRLEPYIGGTDDEDDDTPLE